MGAAQTLIHGTYFIGYPPLNYKAQAKTLIHFPYSIGYHPLNYEAWAWLRP